MKRPNWNEWKHTPSVTVWQACALSMDIDPHSMVPHRRLIGTSSGVGRPMEKDAVGPSLEPYDFSSPDEKEEFERRQRALRMHLSNRKFFSPGVLNQIQQDNSLVRLSEFASWAVSVVEWKGLPAELVEMGKAFETDKAIEWIREIGKHGLGVKAGNPESVAWVKATLSRARDTGQIDSDLLKGLRDLETGGFLDQLSPVAESPASPMVPDYLDPKHPRYAPKLAAAVMAWQAVTDPGKISPKAALTNWLSSHKDDFCLSANGIEEAAKVANWAPQGGSPTA